jgi:uncharacterized membrane protein YjjB (DUF3815 family)
VLSDGRVLQVLDLCMLVGEVLLSSGEPVGETSATMTKLAEAGGLPTVDIDITFTSITMCADRGRAVTPVRSLIGAALAGSVGWSVYGVLTRFAEFGPVLATGAAAVVVGIATGIARRGSGVHSHVIILSGIVPLLPGLTAYRGFYRLAQQEVVYGLVSTVLALAIGLALAAGAALGDFRARPRRPATGASSSA